MSMFDAAYQRPGFLFGDEPSEELVEYLAANSVQGKALDLGSGDGRDTVALLQSGLAVTAIDASAHALRKLVMRPQLSPALLANLTTVVADIWTWQWPLKEYDIVTATTILDHIEKQKLPDVVMHILKAANDDAVIFAEVHTVDDPAVTGQGTVSEFASEIRHYFGWNELLDLFRPYTRVLFYSEKVERDYDHGPEHSHGVATFLGKLTRR